MANLFFDGWPKVLRVFVMALCAYSVLVLVLRLGGKRTLSKMNVFDFVFVVAGSNNPLPQHQPG
jgi:L-cystine uptake protein TcyP (sodium:dicarboxylate symporter family)